MIQNFKDVLTKKYADFSGRARRQEFWLFCLTVVIFQVIMFVVLNVIASATGDFGILYWIFAAILWLALLATLIPMLALEVRRLHDIGKKGTWIFISLVPFVGAIWLLVLLATDSQAGANEFGPNPKGM